MAQRANRFSETTDKGIQDATRKYGFSSPTAFIRHAVEQALSGRSEELVGEERLAATRFIKVGVLVRYPAEGLDEWA